MPHQFVDCLQEAAADNQMKCEAVCAVGRLVAFQSLAAGDWLAPQLVSHMVSHGKEVCLVILYITHSSACACALGHALGVLPVIQCPGLCCPAQGGIAHLATVPDLEVEHSGLHRALHWFKPI